MSSVDDMTWPRLELVEEEGTIKTKTFCDAARRSKYWNLPSLLPKTHRVEGGEKIPILEAASKKSMSTHGDRNLKAIWECLVEEQHISFLPGAPCRARLRVPCPQRVIKKLNYLEKHRWRNNTFMKFKDPADEEKWKGRVRLARDSASAGMKTLSLSVSISGKWGQ